MKRQKKNRIPEEKLTGNPAQNPTENPAGEDYSVEDRALKEAARFLSVFSLLFVIFSGWSIWEGQEPLLLLGKENEVWYIGGKYGRIDDRRKGCRYCSVKYLDTCDIIYIPKTLFQKRESYWNS